MKTQPMPMWPRPHAEVRPRVEERLGAERHNLVSMLLPMVTWSFIRVRRAENVHECHAANPSKP